MVKTKPKQARKQLTLAQYVHYRNGVPLGASQSLQNMLRRSLGAGSFERFWQYWNPIWGYALGRYIYAPLNRFLPTAFAFILTFTISGALHDLATMLVKQAPAFFFTPWFFLMSIVVMIGKVAKLDYTQHPFAIRVLINLIQIIGCLLLTIWITNLAYTG